MPFLAGSLAFERFRVSGFDSEDFEEQHVELLSNYASGARELESPDAVQVGFLGGGHVLDNSFDLGKNVVAGALHCSVGIETNQVPAALKKAWLQIELAALASANESGRPTREQRQEAKESIEARCLQEAASGKFRKMQHFPLLWDLPGERLYFAGSSSTAIGHSLDLMERVFKIQFQRITAGSLALDWATQHKEFAALDDVMPAQFVPEIQHSELAWLGSDLNNKDFLGNEFLVWLWWKLASETDTFSLPDGSEITVMMNKTLTLECPLGENGKESISSESPMYLPEAIRALQSGKLPRKSGLTLIRHGTQYDLTLQAETFSVSSAKIHVDEEADPYDTDARIDAIRELNESLDLLFGLFCSLRIPAKSWKTEVRGIQNWLATANPANLRKNPAA
jgi:hypothetical protein